MSGDSHQSAHARHKYKVIRSKRAQKFRSSKFIRSDQRKLEDTKGRIAVLKAIAETRPLTLAEGRELNSLGKKLQKLERQVITEKFQ